MARRMRARGFERMALTAAYPQAFGEQVRWGRRLTVLPWERAVVLRDGRVLEVADPGTTRVWRRRTTLVRVDVRPQVLEVATQEVPTADGITVKASAVAVFRVDDARRWVQEAQSPWAQLYLAVQVALREAVAATGVDALVAERSDLPARVLAGVRGANRVGAVVEAVEVKDVVLPREVRTARAQVLVARAEGQAALERARGETAALRNLANAARLAEEHPVLVQLRLLHQLGPGGHTVVLGAGATA